MSHFSSNMYSRPNGRGGWEWISISSMSPDYLRSAIRIQMLAIQHLEEQLANALEDELSEDTKISRLMQLLEMRYDRLMKLGKEFVGSKGTPFDQLPHVKKWLDGYTRIPGEYPYK